MRDLTKPHPPSAPPTRSIPPRARQGDRLFEHEVNAAPGRRFRLAGVRSGRHANVKNVQFFARQHLRKVGVTCRASTGDFFIKRPALSTFRLHSATIFTSGSFSSDFA